MVRWASILALLGAAMHLPSCQEREAPCAGDVCKTAPCDGSSCAKDGGAPPPPCTDAFEPNNGSSQASGIGPGTYSGLRICPRDEDWFAVDLRKDDRLTASISVPEGAGLLELAVLSPEAVVLASTAGSGVELRVGDLRALSAGRHLVRVAGKRGGQGEYTLRIEQESRSCAAAAPIERAAAQGAPVLPAAASENVAPRQNVLYRADLAVGERLEAQAGYDASRGDVGLGVYYLGSDDLRPLALALGSGGAARLRYGPVSRDEQVYLRVFVGGAEGNTFSLRTQRTVATERREGRVSGFARYEDRPTTTQGLGPPEPQPLALAEIEIYREADGYVVGSGHTDNLGRFEVSFVNYGEPALAARVLARRYRAFAALEVQRSDSCPEIYAARAPGSIDSAAQPESQVEILARASDAGGAFNIYASLDRALQFLEIQSFSPPPIGLTAYWERGVKQDCGSCYWGGSIFVGGGPSDPDEYDDPVLLHELGHFYEEAYGRSDSPGGIHDGSPTTPALAWSEGFATFFSSLTRDSPLYIDTMSGEALVENLETDTTSGAGGDSQDGKISENLVSGLLWDLYDDLPGEAFDTVHLHPASVLLPTHAYFRGPSYRDRGAPGADLVDYLDGLLCLGQGSRTDLEPLLTSRGFPYDFNGPRRCSFKPRAPVELELRVAAEGPGLGVVVTARATALAAADGLRLRFHTPPGWQRLSGETEAHRAPVDRGEDLILSARVLPGERGALAVGAALLGPGPRVRPTVRSWPEDGDTRSPLGRRGATARGRPLFILGGSP
jgi:hypothetical protein